MWLVWLLITDLFPFAPAHVTDRGVEVLPSHGLKHELHVSGNTRWLSSLYSVLNTDFYQKVSFTVNGNLNPESVQDNLVYMVSF